MDLEAFRGLQKHAVHHEHSEELHKKWVEKAVREIKGGDRIGYGLFGSKLLGCILLRCTSSNVIELKNLVVSPDKSLRNTARTKAYKALVTHAEQASKHRGFSQLEIELLSTHYEQIDIFLSLGYSIQPSHESVPSIGIPHYLLWKHVQPEYHGDPFDYLSMAKWLFKERLRWSVDPKPETLNFGARDERYAYRLQFEVPPPARLTRAQSAQHRGLAVPSRARRTRGGAAQSGSARADPEKGEIAFKAPFRITGDCIIDCGMGEIEDFKDILQRKVKTQGSAIRFLLSTRQLNGLQETALESGFRPVLGGELLRMIGYSVGNEPLTLKREDIRGVVLPVGPSDIAALENLCTRGVPFAYVILNGLGKQIYQMLAPELDDEEDGAHSQEFLAIFCTDSEPTSAKADERRMTVVGWAQIEEAFGCRFHGVEGALRGHKTLWHDSPSDSPSVKFFLNQFSINFNEDDQVFVFYLQRPRLLKDEVPLLEIGAQDAAVRPLLEGAQLYGLSACYAEKLVPLVRNMPYREWEPVPQKASVDLSVEAELLNGLKLSLEVISASQWLQRILYKELSVKTGEALKELRNEIDKEYRESQKEVPASQPALFDFSDFPVSPESASRLKDILRAVQRSHYEFFQQFDNSNPETVSAESNWHAKKLCARMARALNLAQALPLRTTGPEELRKWLEAISRHERTYLVGLTFSSEHRRKIVEPVANALATRFSKDRVFYDSFHQATISQIQARDLLSGIYANDCDLVVAFLSDSYGEGWTGMEWERVLRLARAQPHRLLLIQLTDFEWGKLKVDKENTIFWDIRKDKQDGVYFEPDEICNGILQALNKVRAHERPGSQGWAES